MVQYQSSFVPGVGAGTGDGDGAGVGAGAEFWKCDDWQDKIKDSRYWIMLWLHVSVMNVEDIIIDMVWWQKKWLTILVVL